ncbi:MAG: hypothetical protein D6715_03980 [Calditrichaeota bacterium]|nr:MAG: hypothetical protein D6715_03980 [Calditrichota bacterium]
MLTYAINNIDYLVIGRFLNATQLGYYERAFNLMSLPEKRTSKAVNDVLLSSFSRLQDQDERLVRALQKVITSVAVIAYSVSIWFYFVAPALITVLYGPKWIPSIRPLQIMCISGFIYTFTRLLNPLIYARGLVSQNAARQLIYFLFLSGAVLVGVRGGIVGVAWAIVVSSLFYLALNVSLILRYIPIRLHELFLAQKSAMIYGLLQIGMLELYLHLTRNLVAPDGPVSLFAISAISALAFVGGHLLFRFKDVQGIFNELFGELITMLRKVPGLGWLPCSVQQPGR